MPKPDLARLASLHDARSRDTFLSLYADVTDARYADVLDRRAREVRAALAKEDQAAFDESWSKARRLLSDLVGRRARGAAVFVSPEHGLAESHALALAIPTRVVLDSSPYLRPLARFLDENEPFILVVTDSESAAVYTVDAGEMDLEHRRRLDLIGRHKKGGMSQMRYQRHRQGIKDRLMEEAIDQVARLVDAGEARRIVLAGPGPAKRQLASRLPPALAKLVIGVEDADSAEDVELARFVAIAGKDEAQRSQGALVRLREQLRRGELAITGPFEVARAARDGRVDLLVVQKGAGTGSARSAAKVAGSKCEEHQSFFPLGQTCVCGSEGTEVDLINEAVEGAVRSDATLEFVDAQEPFLKSVGGVGALLRW